MKTVVPPQPIGISLIDADGHEVFEVGPLRLDLGTECATIDGYALALTSAERRLLVHLLKNAGRVWTRKGTARARLRWSFAEHPQGRSDRRAFAEKDRFSADRDGAGRLLHSGEVSVP